MFKELADGCLDAVRISGKAPFYGFQCPLYENAIFLRVASQSSSVVILVYCHLEEESTSVQP